MILEKIRNANPDELKIAVQEYCEHVRKMSLGERHAVERTIYMRAEQLGISRKTLLGWKK